MKIHGRSQGDPNRMLPRTAKN